VHDGRWIDSFSISTWNANRERCFSIADQVAKVLGFGGFDRSCCFERQTAAYRGPNHDDGFGNRFVDCWRVVAVKPSGRTSKVRAAQIAREIAANHFIRCKNNKALFEHRVRNDPRLVGLSPWMVDLIIRVALALFVHWIMKNLTELSAVMDGEETRILEIQGLISDNDNG